MAREPIVSRTFKTTVATILCLNIVTAEPENRTITIPRKMKDEKDILKFARKFNDDENIKFEIGRAHV